MKCVENADFYIGSVCQLNYQYHCEVNEWAIFVEDDTVVEGFCITFKNDAVVGADGTAYE